MASPTRWAWVWVNYESWWWTGRPGELRFMGSQRVRHDWATELNWNNTHLLPHSFCGSHMLSESSAQHPTRLKLKCWPRLRYDFKWNSEFSFTFTSICRIHFLMVVKWNPHFLFILFYFIFYLFILFYFFFLASCHLVWLSELRNLPQIGPNHRTPSRDPLTCEADCSKAIKRISVSRAHLIRSCLVSIILLLINSKSTGYGP